MKNQYNFLKTIDKSTTSSDSNNQEEKINLSSNKQQVKSSLSKLHNLVASKFTTTSNNSSPSSSSSLKLQQQQRLSTQNNSISDKPIQRNARIFSLSTQTSGTNNNTNLAKQAVISKTIKDRQQVSSTSNNSSAPLHEKRNNQMQAGSVKQKDVGTANVSTSKQIATITSVPTTTKQPQTSTVSQKITPELAKCYDEIDQIYDYIRGLAPLPLQLRKIKSIDFEQIERDRRIQQLAAQQHAVAVQQSVSSLSKEQAKTKDESPLSRPMNVVDINLAPKLKTKVRQRNANDDEPLKEPDISSQAILSSRQLLPSSKPNNSNNNDQILSTTSNKPQQRIQGPLPIKVTTTTDNVRPNVKRVESLNLGAATTCLAQPAYLISSSQRGQLFRLPRAHSTSTLNKPGVKNKSTTNGDSSQKAIDSGKNRIVSRTNDEGEQRDVAERTIETRTLPAIKQSRVSMLDTKLVSSSLGRQIKTNQFLPNHQVYNKSKGPKKAVSGDGKVLDYVESFVDDDDVSSVESQSEKSSSSKSLCQSATSEENSSRETSQENLTSDSSNSSSSNSATTSSASSESTTSSSSSDNEQNHPHPLLHHKQQEKQNLQQQKARVLSGSVANIERKLSKLEETEICRSNEKWTEKSHSDYENDTVSGISSSSGDLISHPAAINERIRRRNSSGTGSRENHGSHSSSSTSDKKINLLKHHHRQQQQKQQEQQDSNVDQVEHIYEQIPAHKNLIKQQAADAISGANNNSRPQSLPHSHLMDRSYNQFRNHQRLGADQLASGQARPFNYPVAFAPNIALNQKQNIPPNLLVPLRASYQQQHHQTNQQMSSGGGTYPMPLHAMKNANPNMHAFTSSSQARPLDHRYRLSMNNIHLLSYLNYPFVGPVYNPTEQTTNHKLLMSRSSSSGKLNRIRAPRLSPAQLVAQMQIPHALSKSRREQHQLGQANGGTADRIIKVSSSKQPVFVWQPTNHSPAINHQVNYLRHRAQPADQFYRPGYSLDYQNKRRSERRLTAIGIEESLENVRQQQHQQNLRQNLNYHHYQQQQQQQQQVSSRPLEGSSGVIRAINPHKSTTNLKQATSMSYFEPPQLMKAPLIDDDDDDDEEEEEEESTTCSEDQNEMPVVRVNNASNNKEKQSISSNRRSKKLLADQKAAALIQNRCLNSISDLHSFSSTSGTSDGNDDVNEAEDDDDDDNEDEEDDGDDESSPSNNRKAINRVLDNNDESNFVSSRSFIKCYYGRESSESQKDTNASAKSSRNRLLEDENKYNRIDKENSNSKTRRQIGEKTAESGRSEASRAVKKSNRSGYESSQQQQQQRPNVVTSPIAAMFVAAQQQKSNAGPLVGEFLNAEGPILVRDRRIAALRSDLVRHYQHPTVKVAKVPSYSAQKAQQTQVVQGSPIKTKDHPAISGPAKQVSRFLQDQQAGSTNTTNSTSSYEAAIKNSRESGGNKSIDAQQQVVKGVVSCESSSVNSQQQQQQPQRKKSSSSASQNKHSNNKTQVISNSSSCVGGLIKVPKLNKQSHLLNRPLPKPPVGATPTRRTLAYPSSMNLLSHSHSQAASMNSMTRAKPSPIHSSSKHQPSNGKQKMLVSTNLDSTVTSPVNASKANARSQYLQDLEYRAAQHASLSNDKKQTLMSEQQGFHKSRPANKSNSNSLSPLALSITTHPSPTVTTCTSSGISSRLTAATHLASGSNGSSQRSSSNKQSSRVKSFSELHKQSKQQMIANEGEGELENSRLGSKLDKRADSFALMDDDDVDDDQEEFCNNNDSEEIDCDADRLEAFSSPDVVDLELKHPSASGGDISDKKQVCQTTPATAQRKGETGMSSNLRLFDERFSSKFLDQQLASSNDSLLESINFSGTLNRKPLQNVSATATTAKTAQPT